MNGYPKHLNSKADYYYVKNNFPSAQWKPSWQQLLDSQYAWFTTGKLETKEDGVTDDTHRVIEAINEQATQELIDIASTKKEKASVEPVIEYFQQEYRINPMCKLLRLGFTEDEVVNALAESYE